jgi:Caspase domain
LLARPQQMKYLISSLLFLFCVSPVSAQLTSSELSSFYGSLERQKEEFVGLVDQFNTKSVQLIGEEDKEMVAEERVMMLEELQYVKEALDEMFDEYDWEGFKLKQKISKDLPYVSEPYKRYYDFYSQLEIYQNQLKSEFYACHESLVSAFTDHFGKKDLKEVTLKETEALFDGITRFPVFQSKEVVEFYANRKQGDLDFLGRDMCTNQELYENQVKFMKKKKLDSLWGFYPTEAANAFFVRHLKTKKIGFYEAGYDFDLKKIEEVFDPTYDSIDFDPMYDDWGIESWTTAIASKDGKFYVAEKSWRDDESNDVVKRFSTKYSHLRIPRIHGGHSYGFVAAKDSTGLWCLINISEDSIVSPKYVLYEMIPGFDEKGEVQSWKERNDKAIVMYHNDNTIDYYLSDRFKYEYYESGHCKAKAARRGESEISDYVSYYEDGQVNAVGEIVGSHLIGGSFFVNRLVVFDKEGNKYRSMQFDSTGLWKDSTFFPNGTLHATGYQKNEYTGYLYTRDYLTTSSSMVGFYDYHRDSTWTSYYFSGKPKAKGSYRNNKQLEDWEYYNPFGEMTDQIYKRTVSTEMIFPFRILDLSATTIKTVHNKQNNLGIIYDYYHFSPPVYELWDTKNYRQLSGNYLIPLHGVSFVSDTVLIGNSLEYDGPHWYDIKNGILFFPEETSNWQAEMEGDPALNDTLDTTGEVYDLTKKLVLENLQCQDGLLSISEDSVVYNFNLNTGTLGYEKHSSQLNEIDTIYKKVFEIEELYYAECYNQTMFVDRIGDKFEIKEEGGYVPSGNNRNDYPLVLVKNKRESQHIYIDTYYGQNKLIFENDKKDSVLQRYVKFEGLKNGEYVFFTPDNYYLGSKNIKDIVFFKRGDEYFEFEQFDLKYNRPDIILDRLGYADSALVDAYHSAYQKRLKKMGFTEDMLQDDFHLPEIKIENFEEMPTLHDQGSIDLKLKLEDSKYKLDRINVWVNDVAVYGSNGISLRDKDVHDYSTTLSVDLAKGNNKIQVSVLNQAGAESYKETFEIECTSGKNEPDLYLITIGESEFQQADFNLTYAAKDAKDIAALFDKSKAYGEVKTKTLVNQEVTKENVLALKAFLAEADINDEVMIFIAGHGVLDANLDYFFATYDMDFQNPAEKGLAYEDLESLLDGIKPLKKTLMIDACHSGEIDKDEVELAEADIHEGDNIQFRVVGNTATPKLGSQNTSELTKSLFTDLRKGTGATVISSAGGMEFAMEGDDWSNGLFTYCFIKGIQSKEADYDNNGEIWLSEIKRYVSEQVTKLSNGKQQPTSRIENQVVDFRVW